VLAAGLVIAACGSGDSGSGKETPRPGGTAAGEAARYAAAEAALARDDFDGALERFRKLGGFRDSRARVRAVNRVAAHKTLVNARRKLRLGQTRAAVAQGKTAIERYGADTPANRAFLERAERAQAFFHACQQRNNFTGEQSKPCEHAAAKRFG
jgi:hypothetical protein